MGLYRRGKIFWFTTTRNGRRIQKSTKTSNKRLAEEIFTRVRSDIIEGSFFEKQKARSTTFRELAARYMERYQKQRDPFSIKRLLASFGDLTLAGITSTEVEDYIEKRLHEVKLSTVYKEFALGRRMLNVARKKWKWIRDNPFSDVEFPSINNERDRWLTVQEEQNLLVSVKQEWLRDIIIFAIHTGCRMGEILSLTWKDNVDMQRKVITIQASKGGIKKAIPISNYLYEMLLNQSKISHISGKVFPFKRSTLKDAFQNAIEGSGIVNFHFHDLRHTFATRLVQGGVDLYAIQKLLGHKTIRMTERYAHHYPESLRPSINVLDDCYKSATVEGANTCHEPLESSIINHGSV